MRSEPLRGTKDRDAARDHLTSGFIPVSASDLDDARPCLPARRRNATFGRANYFRHVEKVACHRVKKHNIIVSVVVRGFRKTI